MSWSEGYWLFFPPLLCLWRRHHFLPFKGFDAAGFYRPLRRRALAVFYHEPARPALGTFEDVGAVLFHQSQAAGNLYLRPGLRDLQVPADFCQSFGPALVAQIAVMPDFYKAPGQYVLRKPPGKLTVAQCHLLLLVAVTVVPVPKGNFRIGDFPYPVAGDGYFVRVPSQIIHHPLRISEGGLRIGVPLLISCGLHQHTQPLKRGYRLGMKGINPGNLFFEFSIK